MEECEVLRKALHEEFHRTVKLRAALNDVCDRAEWFIEWGKAAPLIEAVERGRVIQDECADPDAITAKLLGIG